MTVNQAFDKSFFIITGLSLRSLGLVFISGMYKQNIKFKEEIYMQHLQDWLLVLAFVYTCNPIIIS